MDLLRFLMEEAPAQNPKSISEIASGLHRHQEAISRDIAGLKNLGLVLLKKLRQTVYVVPNYERITIQLC